MFHRETNLLIWHNRIHIEVHRLLNTTQHTNKKQHIFVHSKLKLQDTLFCFKLKKKSFYFLCFELQSTAAINLFPSALDYTTIHIYKITISHSVYESYNLKLTKKQKILNP